MECQMSQAIRGSPTMASSMTFVAWKQAFSTTILGGISLFSHIWLFLASQALIHKSLPLVLFILSLRNWMSASRRKGSIIQPRGIGDNRHIYLAFGHWKRIWPLISSSIGQQSHSRPIFNSHTWGAPSFPLSSHPKKCCSKFAPLFAKKS